MKKEVLMLKNYTLERLAELAPLADVTVNHSFMSPNRNSVYVTMQYIRYNRIVGGSIRISDHGVGAFRYHHDKEAYAYNQADVDRFIDGVLPAYNKLDNAIFAAVYIDKNGRERGGILHEEGERSYIETPDGVRFRVTKVMREITK